jgi:hypothetical protein
MHYMEPEWSLPLEPWLMYLLYFGKIHLCVISDFRRAVDLCMYVREVDLPFKCRD